jgi:putative acetyltransferase
MSMSDALPPPRRTTTKNAPAMAQITEFILAAMPGRDIWVAGDPVQGYVSIDSETSRLGGLYCATPGAGLGRTLRARAKAGRDRLALHVHERNAGARRLCAREGFVERERHLPEPPARLVEIRMEWVRHA